MAKMDILDNSFKGKGQNEKNQNEGRGNDIPSTNIGLKKKSKVALNAELDTRKNAITASAKNLIDVNSKRAKVGIIAENDGNDNIINFAANSVADINNDDDIDLADMGNNVRKDIYDFYANLQVGVQARSSNDEIFIMMTSLMSIKKITINDTSLLKPSEAGNLSKALIYLYNSTIDSLREGTNNVWEMPSVTDVSSLLRIPELNNMMKISSNILKGVFGEGDAGNNLVNARVNSMHQLTSLDINGGDIALYNKGMVENLLRVAINIANRNVAELIVNYIDNYVSKMM